MSLSLPQRRINIRLMDTRQAERWAIRVQLIRLSSDAWINMYEFDLEAALNAGAFKNIFNRCKDYVNMVPGKITLATSQC
jgi:hypothetical protein